MCRISRWQLLISSQINFTLQNKLHIDPTIKRILLAEDDDFNQEIAAELLSQRGYELTATNNGQQLLAELLAKPIGFYPLILMDIEMPVMDGYQATQEIRKNSLFEHIPIVALTAHHSEATRTRCREVGMQDFISKPFDPEVLYEKLEKWLGNKGNSEFEIASNAIPHESKFPFLPKLEHIDTERGLQLSGSNQQLYLQLLKRFVETQPTTVNQLTHASTSEISTENFKRLIHTTKSICATIGASNTASRFEELENLLRDAAVNHLTSELSSYLNEAKMSLEHAIAEVRHYLHTQENTVVTSTQQISALIDLHALSEQFIVLLQAADTEAIDFFQKYKADLMMALSTSTFAALSDAVSEYDFDKAILLMSNADHADNTSNEIKGNKIPNKESN